LKFRVLYVNRTINSTFVEALYVTAEAPTMPGDAGLVVPPRKAVGVNL